MDAKREKIEPFDGILIAEDSPTDRVLLKGLLESAGYDVCAAADGEAALAELARRKPRLVISDIVMPGIDGFELCRRVKSAPEGAPPPVLLLTSLADPRDIIQGLQAGADNFVTKPFDPQYLLTRVDHLLAHQRLAKDSRLPLGMKIYFGGEQHFITAERQQILDLLLTTYETAVEKNQALTIAREELKTLNDSLEERVRRRTEELRASEERLQDLYREAQEVSRLKDEFLSTLSHELRTPLTSINGFAQILRACNRLAPEDLNAVEIINRNADSLTRIIDDLLNLSRITRGRLKLQIGDVDVGELARDVVASLKPAIVGRGLTAHLTLGKGSLTISGDSSRLRQVAWNVVSNAVKFSRSNGRIEVHVERTDGIVQFTVRDEGVGIEPAFLPFVFDRFRQGDSSVTRAHGGLGLGLAIARSLVELHGGTIEATSPGSERGVTIKVLLPQGGAGAAERVRTRPTADEAISRKRSTRLAGVRVLVVDDEPDALELLRVVLERAGADVQVATSGSDAYARLVEVGPDVLLADIGMPHEDGYTFLRRVRASTLGVASVPAAAVTAFARDEDRRRALAAGFQAHVIKPVNAEDLVTTVAELAGV